MCISEGLCLIDQSNFPDQVLVNLNAMHQSGMVVNDETWNNVKRRLPFAKASLTMSPNLQIDIRDAHWNWLGQALGRIYLENFSNFMEPLENLRVDEIVIANPDHLFCFHVFQLKFPNAKHIYVFEKYSCNYCPIGFPPKIETTELAAAMSKNSQWTRHRLLFPGSPITLINVLEGNCKLMKTTENCSCTLLVKQIEKDKRR